MDRQPLADMPSGWTTRMCARREMVEREARRISGYVPLPDVSVDGFTPGEE